MPPEVVGHLVQLVRVPVGLVLSPPVHRRRAEVVRAAALDVVHQWFNHFARRGAGSGESNWFNHWIRLRVRVVWTVGVMFRTSRV